MFDVAHVSPWPCFLPALRLKAEICLLGTPPHLSPAASFPSCLIHYFRLQRCIYMKTARKSGIAVDGQLNKEIH